MIRSVSLRTRLIVGVIALAAAGLAVADVVTYTSLHSFLISRTDASLQAAHVSVEGALQQGPPGGPGGGPDGGGSQQFVHATTVAPGVYVQIRSPNGAILASGASRGLPGSTQASPPKLPATIHYSSVSVSGHESAATFDVPATTGGSRYRVRASQEDGGYTVIVASSLHDVDSTLHRLLVVELLVTLAVLAGIAALGLWVVRIGLRPLTAIGATAATIAAGDLSQRVERDDDRTEVGRLGGALNAMLAQIESAFHAREESERKLRRFVSDASHELRTPLAAVRAYAELFTRGAASRPDDLARSMSGITRESERMSLLVEDLLLLARLDEGRPLARDSVNLGEVVLEAIETAQMVEPNRPVDAHVEDATVLGDRDRLRQVVDNLLANVRAHTPAVAPVDVNLSRVDGFARLTVRDHGPGLDDDQARHVFERFYRADASRARASGGVGLGLSIVAAVTDAHDGSASVRSTPGEGATFVIELPLA